ncbi:MAG: alpha-L-fucosidase [Firmicutes bacterium]|nr:alpha-L-fucosidase [Bacillota bacterium]
MEAYLAEIDRVIQQGPYQDTWESLQQYHVPRWYEDIKLGIFIHWGVFSVPAFCDEWYSRKMYIQDNICYQHHVETYGPHTEFGYKDFIPMFKAEHFDPEAWVRLFKEAGAQYMIPVAEHHDGFQMYASDLSHWNAAEMGPHRDVLGELTAEAAKAGLINGASSHRVEHWFFMGPGRLFPSDIHEPLQRGDLYWPSVYRDAPNYDKYSEPLPSQEFLEDWLCRCCEIVDKYHPRIIYFDWWIMHSAVQPYLRKFAAYYYNRAAERGVEVVINYKHDAFAFGSAVVDVERGQFADVKPYVWQTDTSVARNSWCYTVGNDYKSPTQILYDLVDIVSKNGRLLLNIGPKADGTIPDEDASILRAIGKWLRTNGEAIYGAKVWRKSMEGPTAITEGQFTDKKDKSFTHEDFRFTVANGSIYAICMNMDGHDSVTIKSLAESPDARKPDFCGIIRDVQVLGSDVKPVWRQDASGLHVQTEPVTHENPVVFKIIL